MRKRMMILVAALLPLAASAGIKRKPSKPSPPTPIDIYVAAAESRSGAQSRAVTTPGSLWYPGALFSDLARDPKASQVDDLVTIVVAESASAVTTGTTKTQRDSTANYSVNSLFGPKSATGALTNLAKASGSQALTGQGTTTRQNTITTTISARVTRVLPNGFLVLEGAKNIAVNSEVQVITVRGVARPFDIGTDNSVLSNRLAQLEVRINGKGVVGDAIKRPFFLYRLLMGLLPF